MNAKSVKTSLQALITIIIAVSLSIIFVSQIAVASIGEREVPPAEVPQRSDLGPVRATDPLINRGLNALARWDMAEADRVAEELKEKGEWDSGEVLYFRSRLAFFHGDYKKCLDTLEKMEPAQFHGDYENFKSRVENLSRVMADAKSFESEHFIVRVIPGPDEILVNDALKTLEEAYDVLTEDLQVEPTSKVVLEIFPTFRAFEWATGLNEKDVETTGTVAVCKFARLMVTTPRELLRGYSWRDTLSHEFVHYLIFLRAGYNCPIWLHEGIAKYEEKRWRMDEGGLLDPASQTSLAHALEKDELITFDEMEPSFAKLPSASAGQLAFAQVTMCVKYIVQRDGFDAVLGLLEKLRKSSDYKTAIRKQFGEPYDIFMSKWKDFMRSSELTRIDGMDTLKVEIKKGGESAEGEESPESFGIKEGNPVYRYTRLGDLLRGQGRQKAALIEYTKALGQEPNSVYLLNKTAYMELMQGNPDDALPLLERAKKLYPDSYPATYKRLGYVYFLKEDWEKARHYYERSSDINPFDPEVQHRLYQVYEKLGMDEQKKEVAEKLAILSR